MKCKLISTGKGANLLGRKIQDCRVPPLKQGNPPTFPRERHKVFPPAWGGEDGLQETPSQRNPLCPPAVRDPAWQVGGQTLVSGFSAYRDNVPSPPLGDSCQEQGRQRSVLAEGILALEALRV